MTQKAPKKFLLESLAKKVRVRNFEMNDMDAFYRAYRLGAFKAHYPNLPKGLTFEEFSKGFEILCVTGNLTPVTFLAFEENAFIPVGAGFLWVRGRAIQNENLIWFPWATPRNVYESVLNYFDLFRRLIDPVTKRNLFILEFANEKDEKFFDRMVALGVLQKVGKIPDVYENGENCILYVTKEVKE